MQAFPDPLEDGSMTRSIIAELQAIMAEEAGRASRHGAEVAELWAAASRLIEGGKLMRPRLLMMVHDAFAADARESGTPVAAAVDRSQTLRLAAALEVLHYSFLLHDDVIDNDLERRGRENFIGALARGGSEGPVDPADPTRLHWARSAAILVGDLLLCRVHQIFARADVATDLRMDLLDLLDHAVTESAVGEFLDVSLGDGILQPSGGVIAEMTRMKTATYSVELPLSLAAALHGASPRTREALGIAGRHLGIAFQLQDDVLSAFGEAPEHGKDPWSDFREGKQTTIMDFARTTPAWPAIDEALGREELRDEQGRHVQQLLIDCGAREEAHRVIARELESAREVLEDSAGDAEGPAVPATVAAALGEIMDTLAGRLR